MGYAAEPLNRRGASNAFRLRERQNGTKMNDQNVHALTYGSKTIRLHLPRPNDLIQKRIIATGQFYELEMLEHARHLLNPGDHVLDIGANIGTHSIFLAAVCGARVIAFEPQPDSARTLRENVQLNQLDQEVSVFEHGLGNGDGKADIVVADEQNLGRCSLRHTTEGAVEVKSYDGLALGRVIKLVKLDVEGMERDVLRGMIGMLKEHQPALYVEIQDSAELATIRADLGTFGYKLIECFNSTPTYCFMPANTADQQFEALMSRWDASLRSRVRTASSELSVDDRGTAADKLRDLSRSIDRLEKSKLSLAQLQNMQREALKPTETQLGQLTAASDKHDVRQLELIKRLNARLANLENQSDRTLRECRQMNRSRLLPKLITAITKPRLTAKAIMNRLTGQRPKRAETPTPQTQAETPTPATGTSQFVSVVMTSHNSAAFIERAVRSILDQTHKTLELLVVDDASTDDTVDILAKLSAADDRLRVLRCYSNRGTYWAKNLGLQHALGKYVTTQDSDDFSHPERIQRQLSLLGEPGRAIIATCNYIRVDEKGEVVMNRGLKERLGLITLMFEKIPVLDRIGFYDSVRTSADAEFLQRMRLAFPKPCFAHVNEPLYTAEMRSGSLSADTVNLGASKGQKEFLSEARQHYVEAYEEWHGSVPSPQMAFPLRRRPFDAPKQLVRDCLWGDELITVSLASIPSRRAGLMRVVESLLGQVDQLNVYLNNYESVPAFLNHPRIRVARSQDHGDLRDNGKFFFLEGARPGYYFTVDDDIVYPDNYVSYLVSKLKQYGDQVIVGFHGTTLPAIFERFFSKNGRTVLSFKHALAEDRQVHLLGSGTTAWHTSTLPLSLRDFETTGMADVWLGVGAQQHAVPMISVTRDQGYLEPIEDIEKGSLYEEFVDDDGQQTSLVKQHMPWQLPPLPEPRQPVAAD
jgi:FkbM family methyltransferase